jgi:tetrahydromethanopterin S-methyltransferase subunit B
MTFEEFIKHSKFVLDEKTYEASKETWYYQQFWIDELQEKIDHLETLIDTVDSALSGWRYYKEDEQ